MGRGFTSAGRLSIMTTIGAAHFPNVSSYSGLPSMLFSLGKFQSPPGQISFRSIQAPIFVPKPYGFPFDEMLTPMTAQVFDYGFVEIECRWGNIIFPKSLLTQIYEGSQLPHLILRIQLRVFSAVQKLSYLEKAVPPHCVVNKSISDVIVFVPIHPFSRDCAVPGKDHDCDVCFHFFPCNHWIWFIQKQSVQSRLFQKKHSIIASSTNISNAS